VGGGWGLGEEGVGGVERCAQNHGHTRAATDLDVDGEGERDGIQRGAEVLARQR
jgi:hypothetical protein